LLALSLRSSLSIQGGAHVSFRLHALVKHTDDLDESGLNDAVENHMHRLAQGDLAALVAAVPNREAAQASEEFALVRCLSPLRVGGDPAHGRRQQPATAEASVPAMPRLAGAQHRGDVGLRWFG
jgi:hypothetical protein